MMIIRQPHPLDLFWRDLPEAVGDAFDAVEALPDGAPEEVVDRAVDAAVKKLEALLALPARGVEDILAKLDLLHVPGGPRTNFDMQVLIEEFCNVVSAGLQAGKSLQADQPQPEEVGPAPILATEPQDGEALEAWSMAQEMRKALLDKLQPHPDCLQALLNFEQAHLRFAMLLAHGKTGATQ